MSRFNAIRAVLGLILVPFVVTAQSLTHVPNADFSRWNGPEPAGWYTNNVYDEQGKLLRTVVEHAGTTGVRLLALRTVHRAAAPALVAYEGGELTSPLLPQFVDPKQPVQLQIRYQFAPDSADVLRVDVSLESRDTEPNSPKPNPHCTCTVTSSLGTLPLSLPVASDAKRLTVNAVFASTERPNLPPPGCLLYVWKVRFWLENKSSHLHEKTTATLEHVDYQP